MKNWETLSKETLLHVNKFLTVEKHSVKLPDGQIIDNWPWVITPDFINLLAVTSDQKFICLLHPKYAVDGNTLAPVGGYMETGEEPLAAAKRELQEETGFSSDQWIDLGSYIVDSNRGCGRGFLFLAKNATKVGEPTEIDMENPEIIFLTKDELISALMNGEFKVLSYALTISLALAKL